MAGYFHIGFRYSPNLGNENESIIGYNYEEKFFKNSIVKPYLSGKEFSVKGKWINPKRGLIREIQVFKTAEKISEFKIPIIDYIVTGEGMSSETMELAIVQHELVTDLFITSKPPTPLAIGKEKIEKHKEHSDNL